MRGCILRIWNIFPDLQRRKAKFKSPGWNAFNHQRDWLENWFKEKPAQYFSLVLLVSVLNFGVVFVVFSVVSMSATTFIVFQMLSGNVS